MKVLGRRPRNVVRALLRWPEYLGGIARAFVVFERPLEVIRAYVMRRTPASGMVRVRGGTTIRLSSDPADVVTVFVIFAREDYGRIARGATVIDIGANIGVFSLYAAYCGARQVLAYEPSAESFACLERNIRDNQLDAVVLASRAAVGASADTTVRFPRRSSVMNTVAPIGDADDCDDVPSTTIDAILRPVEKADLVKLDCEGAEYDILFTATDAAYRKIDSVTLEYHQGRRDELVSWLRDRSLVAVRETANNEVGGVLWFVRTATPDPHAPA